MELKIKFVFLMMLALILDIAGIVLLNTYDDEIIEKYSKSVENAFDKLPLNYEEADSFQKVLHCCGAKRLIN